MDTIIIGTILALTFCAAAGTGFYLVWLKQQVQYVILADGRRQERSLPVFIRAFLPFTTFFPRAFQSPFFNRYFDELDRKVI
jgi:hypothetical protein